MSDVSIEQRVFVVDADGPATPENVRALLAPGDIVLVSGNPQTLETQAWYQTISLLKDVEAQVLKAPAGLREAADMTLSFHAGELLARALSLKKCPWVVISADRGFQTLVYWLVQRGVSLVTQ